MHVSCKRFIAHLELNREPLSIRVTFALARSSEVPPRHGGGGRRGDRRRRRLRRCLSKTFFDFLSRSLDGRGRVDRLCAN